MTNTFAGIFSNMGQKEAPHTCLYILIMVYIKNPLNKSGNGFEGKCFFSTFAREIEQNLKKTAHMTNKTNILLMIITAMFILSCTSHSDRWHIGVSQCSEDVWRYKLNRELTIAGYVYNNVDLEFFSGDNSDEKQIEQIEHFISEGVDLIIVAPNKAATLSEVIDKAYDSGIPVILFDRKTTSEKYTSYMGADNYEVGFTMGKLIGEQMSGKGVLVEICGLRGSSPAIERHRGFQEAMKSYPDIHVVSSELGDWTEESGRHAMREILKHQKHVDCLFGHNDRLALGARSVAIDSGLTEIKYYGVDALPTPGGGIERVLDGTLEASYIYPTQGLELMQLAINILSNKPYKRHNTLHSTVADTANAKLTLMQYRELERASTDLEILYDKLTDYFLMVNTQKKVIITFVILMAAVILLTVATYRSMIVKSALNRRLAASNIELKQLYKQLEDMADARMVSFTNIGHKLRTPITLIAGPMQELAADATLRGEPRRLVDIMYRNTEELTHLVDEILDFRKIGTEKNETAPSTCTESKQATVATEEVVRTDKPVILVVDDNADIRALLQSVLKEKYHIVEAPDGEAGLQVARRIVPDLIVSDVMMPVMDGLEMCRQVKADDITCHIPVLMLTARTLEEHRLEGYTHGADAYITKPFSSPILKARINNLLTTRKTLRRVFARGLAMQPPSSPPDTQATDSKDNAFITRLRNVIQKNISNPDFSVERIGEEIGMSRVQLYRKAKALTGMSPVELLRKSRVERGLHLLETTDRTISEIAYETGFSAPSYFAKCFKDEYGKSPGEARNQRQDNI